MKRNITYKIISLTVIILGSILLHAQQSDPNDNYYDLLQAKREYIEQLAIEKDVDITELKEYKHFVIWSEHFGTKHDKYGSMSAFGEAINNYYENNTDTEGDLEFAWEYNAPDGLWPHINPNYPDTNTNAGQGLIISLWVDNDSADHIMAGGQYSGGLWETHDGGTGIIYR